MLKEFFKGKDFIGPEVFLHSILTKDVNLSFLFTSFQIQTFHKWNALQGFFFSYMKRIFLLNLMNFIFDVIWMLLI